MPIFEFACNECSSKRFSELVGVLAQTSPIQCPQCGSQNIRKLVSRFARIRSLDESLENLADMADRVDDKSLKSVRGLMKEVAGGMGDDMSTDDVEEMIEAAAELE
ncbi:zinc ribbon domain-containing protein [Armatimonas sp.]|uniref:FmdB family zinc ribbon protein n=1 Tax=Armatimonas sp. TaxID=1872638 RepID=UPI00286A42EA|nr:zinc ribbon domain-containing protein [Armatimonas sp.]